MHFDDNYRWLENNKFQAICESGLRGIGGRVGKIFNRVGALRCIKSSTNLEKKNTGKPLYLQTLCESGLEGSSWGNRGETGFKAGQSGCTER